MQGSAPEGMEFADVEEEYQIDEHGVGKWVTAARREDPADGDIPATHTKEKSRKPQTKSRRGGAAKKQSGGVAKEVI